MSPQFSRQGLSPILEIIKSAWLAANPQGPPVSAPPVLGLQLFTTTAPRFYMGAGDLHYTITLGRQALYRENYLPQIPYPFFSITWFLLWDSVWVSIFALSDDSWSRNTLFKLSALVISVKKRIPIFSYYYDYSAHLCVFGDRPAMYPWLALKLLETDWPLPPERWD